MPETCCVIANCRTDCSPRDNLPFLSGSELTIHVNPNEEFTLRNGKSARKRRKRSRFVVHVLDNGKLIEHDLCFFQGIPFPDSSGFSHFLLDRKRSEKKKSSLIKNQCRKKKVQAESSLEITQKQNLRFLHFLIKSTCFYHIIHIFCY